MHLGDEVLTFHCHFIEKLPDKFARYYQIHISFGYDLSWF